MLGDKSWALPYFGGLKSPLASKSTLYNAWLAGQPSTVAPVVPVVPGIASQKPIQTLPTLSEQIDILSKPSIVSAPEEFYAATPAIGRVSDNSTGADDTGASPLSGMGLGKLGSTGVSLGSAALMGMGNVPLAGPLSKIAGMIAGNGINAENVGNMVINTALTGMGLPGLVMAGLNMAGFNPYGGVASWFDSKDYAAEGGHPGGFFTKQSDYNGYTPGQPYEPGTANLVSPSPLPIQGLYDTGAWGIDSGNIGGGIDTSPGSGFDSGSWGMSSNSNYGMGGGSMDTSPGSGFNTGGWGMGGSSSGGMGGGGDSGDSGGGD